MSMRALCLAGALTLGLGTAVSAQSIGVSTPFGGVGIYGPDRYAYADRYREPAGVGVYAYGPGAVEDAYAYDPAYEAYAAPSNLHLANPNANPNLTRGWTIPERDQYRSERGFNSY